MSVNTNVERSAGNEDVDLYLQMLVTCLVSRNDL